MISSAQALEQGVRLQSAKRTYVIEGALGQGGFGITYLASTTMHIDDIAVDVTVAIKELFIGDLCERVPGSNEVRTLSSMSQRVATARKDFLAEARRLQTVGRLSRNIVKVSEVFEANNTAYYVMEYLSGKSLSSYINEKGKLTDNAIVGFGGDSDPAWWYWTNEAKDYSSAWYVDMFHRGIVDNHFKGSNEYKRARGVVPVP